MDQKMANRSHPTPPTLPFTPSADKKRSVTSQLSSIRYPSQNLKPLYSTPVVQSTNLSTQPTNQTNTQIPTKGIRAPRPSSTSSIPQISGPTVSTKCVILRNKNNVCNPQQSPQTIVDKIKHYNKSGQQIATNGEQCIPHTIVNNKCESNISKRTSGSSGFSSAKSDSSASLCGLETNVSTVVVNSKTKPTVTQPVSKTRTTNQSANTSCVSLNTNINSNNNNLSNNLLKKNEEILNNCENYKSNVNNNNHNIYKSLNSNAKLGSIPVKRIQPPRSRPTSTIIDNNLIPSTMASSSQSTSNTSLVTIAKPTAAVKGTSKVFASEENRTNSRKLENQSSSCEQNSQINNNSKMKINSDKYCSQTQVPTLNSKHEPSIAMVSPIMSREQSYRFKTIGEESSSKEQNQINSKMSANNSKKIEEKNNKKDKKIEKHMNGVQQQSSESGLQDSSTSSQIDEEESASNSDLDSSLVNIKPMAPLVRTSQFAFLRNNANQMCNGSVYSRYPNNYSSIEDGYLSDCVLINNNSRSNYRDCYSPSGSTPGYVSESDVCSPHFKRNRLMATKIDYITNATNNRHNNETQTERNQKKDQIYHSWLNIQMRPHLRCANDTTKRQHLTQSQMDATARTNRQVSIARNSLTSDDKNELEVRKLRRELIQANEKVSTLTSQLTTNAHMVAAFEQSLSSMTARLQQLSASSELKDCELERLKTTIETLKKQSSHSDTNHHSSKQSSNANKVKTASLIRRHTFTNDGKGDDSNSRIARQLSVESVSSVSSGADSSITHKSKKKSKTAKILNSSSSGWLRSSFSKAFKKNKTIVKRDALSDAEVLSGNEGDYSSVPNSPLMSSRSFRSGLMTNGNDFNEPEVVQDLKRQLREKEMVLTDLRLESLTSAHQLENLKETINQLRAEMLNLKQDNDRLKRLVSSKSLASSQSSMASGIYAQNSVANGSSFTGRQNGQIPENDSLKTLEIEAVTNTLLCDGGKLVTVGSGTHIIASLVVTPKTNWEQLDLMIKKSFEEHINRIDTTNGLGLTFDALACYQVGIEKIQRAILPNKSTSSQSNPELLPFGYLVNENHIYLQFKSASDSLVFDTLTPKSIIHRYINLLSEHRRMILCGPSGSGKTYMAHKLAEYLAIKTAAESRGQIECCPVGSIATFSVDHKSAKELRAYLSNVAEQCESETLSLHLPTVIILDNLHHIGSIDEVFNGLINIMHTKCPYIIGTMNQTTCSTANLQLHHNFRWVLCTNNMEPVKGFLSRFLKRKLIETEVKMASNNMTLNPELNRIIDWIPKLWNHLNHFLESHSSSDVTIGPRLFSSCPIDISGSQVWFTDLWNYSIVPYVVEATREGIQMYGQRTVFVDPTEWVCESYPWSASGEWIQHLLRIKAEDVNYENSKQINSNESESLAQNSSDPLLNMLMRLQEAANYSSQPNQSYNQNNGNPNNNTTSVSIVNSGIESSL